MKLYATTTSERASKGQGGNKYLIVNIQDEYKNNILTIGYLSDGKKMYLNKVTGDYMVLHALKSHIESAMKNEVTKGKQKKDETQSEKFFREKNNGSM